MVVVRKIARDAMIKRRDVTAENVEEQNAHYVEIHSHPVRNV